MAIPAAQRSDGQVDPTGVEGAFEAGGVRWAAMASRLQGQAAIAC